MQVQYTSDAVQYIKMHSPTLPQKLHEDNASAGEYSHQALARTLSPTPSPLYNIMRESRRIARSKITVTGAIPTSANYRGPKQRFRFRHYF